MPIFPNYRKNYCQKLKQNKSRYSQELIKFTSKKSPSFLSDFTNENSNVTKQNPKFNV